MSVLKFYRGTEAQVDRHLYEEGAVYLIEQSGKKGQFAVDLDGTRFVIGGLQVVDWDDIQNKPSFTNDNTTYTLTQGIDGHQLTFASSDGSSVTYTIPDNNDNTTYTLSQDAFNQRVIYLTPSSGTRQSIEIPAVEGVTYTLSISGHRVILTGSDGSTTSVDVPDTDTTYEAGFGIVFDGTKIVNAGVRSISTGDTNGTIKVNTNGTSADVAVKGLGSAAYTSSSDYSAVGHTHTADSIVSGTFDIARIPTIPATKISGTISSANLPSYVDDVQEFSNMSAFPSTGETGKIYVDTSTNKTYRWSGSTYIALESGTGSSVLNGVLLIP